ncbi:MAG: hypothetical protein EOM20_11610 [Spartobacteria bacterium]|nr:hypothetical protein [Spartobacteria bacterium]
MSADECDVLMEFPEEFRVVIRRYARVEQDIRALVQERCSHICGLCPVICCRYDICEEVGDSPFLSLLQALYTPDEYMDDRYGWLGGAGCLLTCGRPPVCYAFFCDELLACFEDARERYILETLGRLIGYIGDRALGRRHLVEITDREQLHKLNLKRIMKRTEEAHEVYRIIRDYFAGNSITDEGWQALAHIKATIDMHP